MGKAGTVIRTCVGLLCFMLVGFSIYRVSMANREYTKEESQHRELVEKYRPKANREALKAEQETPKTGQILNQGILDLQSVNPDVVGWITVPDTYIDHPFVWAADYDEYLRTDVYGQESVSGAIFMDYRLDRNMGDFYSILYGHNMDNGSMFGSLIRFKERDFYQSHKSARLSFPDQNIALELVSCMVVESTDEMVYGIKDSDVKKQNFLKYLREKSIHGETVVPGDLTIEDRLVTLSTCSYDYTEARTVVVYRMIEENGGQ